MKRTEFEKLIKDDHKAAVTWLAQQMFDTYDLEDLRQLWIDFHTGDVILHPLKDWETEWVLHHADEIVAWDEEEENDSAADILGDEFEKLISETEYAGPTDDDGLPLGTENP